MTPTTSHRNRLFVIAFLLLAGLAGLGYRLYELHVVRRPELLTELNGRRQKIILPALRGSILDCNDNVLAQSVPVNDVGVDLRILREDSAVRLRAGKSDQISELAALLADHLTLPLSEVQRKLQESRDYVSLKHKVPEESSRQLKGALRVARLRGVVFDDAQARIYPNGQLMSHVLGFMNSSQQGMDGVEWRMQKELKGQDGWRWIEKDRKGREIVVFRNEDFAAQDGRNVVLTLDQAIQNIVEQELDRAVQSHRPDSAVAIVMRPGTGEILAMASRPTYDPNSSEKNVDAMRNRAVSDVNEPGSTFKIVTVASALDQRLVGLEDTVFCENGKWFYGGRYLNDHEPYGWLSTVGVLVHSSNIGASKIALKLGNARMHRAMEDFGFGERAFGRDSADRWPGEVRGIVRPLKNWSQVSITRVAMGHEVAVTPIQIAVAMCALANGGNLMRPQIIKRVQDSKGRVIREFFPEVRRRVVDRKAARDMTRALCLVVSKEGTAAKAAIPGFDVAGKTGTAQKIVNGQYVHDQFVASFVGYFPARDPEVLIYVMLDHPKGRDYSGGAVAAPIFHDIGVRVASYMNLKPERSSPSTPVSSTTGILPVSNNGKGFQ